MWLIRVTYGIWQKCGVDEAATRSRRSVPGEAALGDSLETSSDGFRILTYMMSARDEVTRANASKRDSGLGETLGACGLSEASDTGKAHNSPPL